MPDDIYKHPEPVPSASQLAVLPFLAAIDGYLRADDSISGLRLTMHRAMSREGEAYLQQICPYVNESGVESQSKVGRFFPLNSQVIGAAYATARIWRTRKFTDLDALNSEIKRHDGDNANSYLAVPFVGPEDQVVLILYADCDQLNFFADDDRVRCIAQMGKGFCRMFDGLQKDPFPLLRNFPLQEGKPMLGDANLYDIHEQLIGIDPPKFNEVFSFNYEAAVA